MDIIHPDELQTPPLKDNEQDGPEPSPADFPTTVKFEPLKPSQMNVRQP
jgi:hypothetical protein